MIVKDQKVADPLIFKVHPQVELVDQPLVVPAVGSSDSRCMIAIWIR